MEQNQKECQQCGTCCTSGGPALHKEDKHLVVDGDLPLAQLITIRKGELARNPLTNSLKPVEKELVKISGVGRGWNCYYFDSESKRCTIYDTRPQACRVLQCWDTTEIEKLFEKDTLSRLDLLDSSNKIRKCIEEHEKAFPCPDLMTLREFGPQGKEAEVEELINQEIIFRTKVVGQFELSLGEELFYFGRPVFHLLVSIGVRVDEVDQRLIVSWPAQPSDSR